jgi:S-adenosylmethionine:tRNA ribosyltransferase-isomerase
MDRRLFSFNLPAELIAQDALTQRSASRLLVVRGSSAPWQDAQFLDLPSLLSPGDLLVFNDTRVLPARLFGRKPSGGQVEMLVERLLDAHTARVQMKVSKKPQPGAVIELEDGSTLRMLGRHDSFFELRSSEPWTSLLDRLGHMPLPPYIERPDVVLDRSRYQTVYAQVPGAVAAPTAGLHFDDTVFAALQARGVRRSQITLHVGAGTFQPIRVDDLDEHRMHSEWIDVSADTVQAVRETRAAGGRVIAVGTTALRALESAAAVHGGALAPYQGETEIFIKPGFEFRVIDGLLTNFHLPESSLLVLVSALMGRERMLAAYQHAIEQRYRFFSYGDASLLLPEFSR